MRVLEAHVVEVRLLRTKRTLELAYLLLEAHAAAALLDGVLVESFALLREGHELVRLRVNAPIHASSRRRLFTMSENARFADAAGGLCSQICLISEAYFHTL